MTRHREKGGYHKVPSARPQRAGDRRNQRLGQAQSGGTHWPIVGSNSTGVPLTGRMTDKTWKTSQRKEKGWIEPKFDDSAWAASREVANYGDPPWGLINERQLTIEPR